VWYYNSLVITIIIIIIIIEILVWVGAGDDRPLAITTAPRIVVRVIIIMSSRYRRVVSGRFLLASIFVPRARDRLENFPPVVDRGKKIVGALSEAVAVK